MIIDILPDFCSFCGEEKDFSIQDDEKFCYRCTAIIQRLEEQIRQRNQELINHSQDCKYDPWEI